MIELTAVGFAYGTAPVLEAIDFSVCPGELVAVVGPNGAGKSTLLRLCAGLLEPTSGNVRVLGSSPTDVSRAQLARRLAFVPQSYRLAFPFSVRDVVLMGRYPHGRRGLFGFESATDNDAADRAIERCDLTELAERRFDSLSGGEHRRVLLAQAFCQQAELILLDEPTANLDPAHALAVWDALLERKRTEGERCAAVVVTHDLNLAIRYSDRIVLVHDRAIATDGPPRDVLSSDAASSAFGVAMHIGDLPGTDRPFAVPT